MRILLTGRNGQVGHHLATGLQTIGQVTATDRPELDLENESAIRAFVRDLNPGLIVNAAAWTAVDRAEEEPDRADAVNHRAPAVLAEEAKRLGAALVHFSTDYVFDGRKPGPWSEDDAPAPLNVYGRTKLAGENAIRTTGAPHLILRLSWVYDRRGRNFLNTISRLLREKDEVAVVEDQFGSPTWSLIIARATLQILDRILETGDPLSDAFNRTTGTFHLTGPGRASWLDFANAIRTHLVARDESVGTLRGIPSAEYPMPAARPRNSLLCSHRAKEWFGVELPAWEEQLEMCMAED